ncbi:mucin-like protein [Oculina patagonica]
MSQGNSMATAVCAVLLSTVFLQVSPLQFTSPYNGNNVTGFLGSSVNFNWTFSGDVAGIVWGPKMNDSIAIKDILVAIHKNTTASIVAPSQYSGRVNGAWDGRSPGKAIFTLKSIQKADEGFYVCRIRPVSILEQDVFDIVQLLVSDKPVTPTMSANISEHMYPYGSKQNDNEFRLEDSPYYYSDHCLRINTDWTGFPFFSKRHYKLHICRNGLIQLNYEWSWWWPRKFGVYYWLRNMAVIAPFWATTDTYLAFRANHSKVYYQVYTPESNESSADILSMATEHVQRFTGNFTNFEATWVLVVTWENLCPYVYYSYYYYNYYYYHYKENFTLNCPWSNTFQAVLITDGFNTFLMYNYPHGGIQWVVPANRENYRYWTGYYGLPVAGWNAGDDGKSYLNIKGSATLLGMYDLPITVGNTGLPGKHFWRVEKSNANDALEKCLTWTFLQKKIDVHKWYEQLIRSDWQMACPCTFWQARLDGGRFSWNWRYSWPELCYASRRSKFIPYSNARIGLRGFQLRQKCCYSTQWENWGSLKVGPPDGGRVEVTADYDWFNMMNEVEKVYSDQEAYKYCCVDTHLCDMFYFFRPSDDCLLYRAPRRRKFNVYFTALLPCTLSYTIHTT